MLEKWRYKWKKYTIIQMTGDIIMILALFGLVYHVVNISMGIFILGSGLILHIIGWFLTPKKEKDFDWSGLWNLGRIS